MRTSHAFLLVGLLVLLGIVGGVYGLRGPGGSAQVMHEMMSDFSKLVAWIKSYWQSAPSSSGPPRVRS